MSHRVLLALALSFAVGTIAGCTCATPGTGVQFACDTQADCLAGESCVERLCVSQSDGGGAGGGTGGGAMGGGAGGGTGGGATGGGGGSACAENVEVCGDDVDDNCNGVLDDGCPCIGASQPCYPLPGGLESPTLKYPWDGTSGCSPGTQACVNGALAAACVNVHVPQNEFCDGLDTDCDGVPDPAVCSCQQGKACYLGPPNTINADPTSICAAGTWSCSGTPTCQGQVLPGVETCNGLDDDCNGQVDDNADTPSCGPGVCDSVKQACVNGAPEACNLTTNPPPGYATTEVCNDGLDNDCGGMVDEGCTCVLDAGVPCWTGAASACPSDGGTCKGICQRGVQRCVLLSDGGTGYSSCMGQTLPATESCTDAADNDCDGQVDCADGYCTGKACGAGNGNTCSGGGCSCSGNGGTAQGSETICDDGHDNDCNALTDCAEPFCSGKACGTAGRLCVGTNCTCVVDGGMAQPGGETICNDGLDNDCNSLTDCAEAACNGQGCGTGKTCVGGTCTAPDAGCTVQTSEYTCNDGCDNDGDGLIDCAEGNTSSSSCWDRTCAANGFKCRTNGCECRGNGGTIEVNRELSCNDQADNDCDGLEDCADPDCQTDAGVCVVELDCEDGSDNDQDGRTDCADTDCIHQPCSASNNYAVCCGPWPAVPNTATCTSINTASNCGGCGIACPSGTCVQASSSGHYGGRCTCPDGGASLCPDPNSQQSCSASSLTCDCSDSDSRCGQSSQGARCRQVSGADFCYYSGN